MLVSSQTDKNQIQKCVFCDFEYNFEYYLQISMKDIIIDGSTFKSIENTFSDFPSKYLELMKKCYKFDFDNIQKTYHINIELDFYSDLYHMSITCIKENCDFIKAAQKISDLIISFDTRRYYRNQHLNIYEMNGNRLGAYYIHEKKWVDVSDEINEFYIERAKTLNKNSMFVRKEKKTFKDTGLKPEQVQREFEYTDETPVTYYYFTVNDKEFFIADFILDRNSKPILQYNNYNEVFN
ncbi:MAG: hypothetical protein IIT39_17300 [Clostridia bacterium]|nr:hypothetical protein [Clostridia bacterium]